MYRYLYRYMYIVVKRVVIQFLKHLILNNPKYHLIPNKFIDNTIDKSSICN